MVETEEDQSSGRMEEGPTQQLIIQNVTEESDDPSPCRHGKTYFISTGGREWKEHVFKIGRREYTAWCDCSYLHSSITNIFNLKLKTEKLI